MVPKIKVAPIMGAIALIAVVVIGFNVTAVNAQAGGNRNGNDGFRSVGIRIAQALFAAVEQATGLTQQQLFTELDGTKTLTDIVTEHHGDPGAVEAAAKTTLTNEINAAVTASKITQTQADKLIARLDTLLSGLMNRKFNLDRGLDRIQRLIHGIEVNALIQRTAHATNQTPREIVKALNGEQTLAQIAQVHNADVTAIVNSVTTALTNRINRLVTAGRLTQDQATKLINALPASLTAIMNQTNPLNPTGSSPSGTAAPTDAATPSATSTQAPTVQPTQPATPSLNAT